MTLSIILLTFGLLLASGLIIGNPAFAAENSYLIEADRLTRKINSGFTRIHSVAKATNQKSRNLETIIEAKVKEAHTARSELELVACQKEYLGYRFEALENSAEKVDVDEEVLNNIFFNMERLEEAQKKTNTFGLGKGVEAGNFQTEVAVAEVLKGQQNIINMIRSVSPKANISNQANALQIKIDIAREFFTKKNSASLAKQKETILESLILVREVKSLLRLAHDDLLMKIYYVDAQHIARVVGELHVDVIGTAINGNTGLNKWREVDEDILNIQVENDSDNSPINSAHLYGNNQKLGFGNH
jgi:hypothetical protein